MSELINAIKGLSQEPQVIIFTNHKDYWQIVKGNAIRVQPSKDAIFIYDLKIEDIEEAKSILQVFMNSKVWIDKQDLLI